MPTEAEKRTRLSCLFNQAISKREKAYRLSPPKSEEGIAQPNPQVKRDSSRTESDALPPLTTSAGDTTIK